jgi:tetrahydromethanopterin S-methyltransferase subunit G
MTTEVTKEEFDHLKARVDVVEREVEGEKTVTRHILEQTRRNGDDLATVKSRLDRHDQRFEAWNAGLMAWSARSRLGAPDGWLEEGPAKNRWRWHARRAART